MKTPSLPDLRESAYVVDIPLRVPFRGITSRQTMLLRGPAGWAEFGAFAEYADTEAATWLRSAVEAGWGEPVSRVRESVAVNATVPAVASSEVRGILDAFGGCTTAKVKVAQRGQDLGDDVARVAAVRDRLGPSGKVRVDANGAWDVPQARRALRSLSAYDLEYAEQPVAEVADLARLRVALAHDRIEVPVAADESIRRAQDPMLVARMEAADLIVVKVAPLGGVAAALAIVADCGLPAVVSSALDTSVGIAAGVRLACALPQLDHACGLGTVALFGGDVCRQPLLAADGVLSHDLAARATQEVDLDLLHRYRADEASTSWWHDRLRRCREQLG